MPVHSCLAILPAPASTDIVPFNPSNNPDILSPILETLYLTMSLKCHHIHDISKQHNIYSLDFYLTKIGRFHLPLHHVLGLKFYLLVAATTFMEFLRILFPQVFS